MDEIGLNVGVIHALWTLHGLGALDGKRGDVTAAAVAALKHPSAGVRRNAVQVLPREVKSVQAILDAGLPRDHDPQVRLLALLALADQPATAAAGQAIVAALMDPQNANDRWLPDAATAAAAKNTEHFLMALSACKAPPAKLLAVAMIVAEHYARGTPVDSVGGLIAGLTEADPKIADAIIRGLAIGWPMSAPPKLDKELERDLEKLLTRVGPERRGLLIKLARTWGSKRFEKYAGRGDQIVMGEGEVMNNTLATEVRLAAARELIGQTSTDKETVRTLLDLITPRTPSDVAAGLLQALQATDAEDTASLILERLPNLTPSARAAALGVLLSRPAWTKALLASADKGKLHLAELTLDQRQALTDHPDLAIRNKAKQLLKRGGALPNPDREKVLQEFLPIAKETGDAKAGKEIFLKNCAKCHVHGAEGARIGPDLTGMAVHTKEHLLTDILDPSRSVEANFRSYQVTLKNGRVLSGLLASESKTAIEVFDAEGKKHSILRQDIDELTASTKSLMPDGFEKQANRKELTDLLEFLTKRGKFLPLPLDKAATIVSTRGMFNHEDDKAECLLFDDWKPKTFAGVPFHLVDPQGERTPNVVLLYSSSGKIPPKMPKSVSLPCNASVKTLHLLSGVGGWCSPHGPRNGEALIVRLHYAGGKTEDHPLKNGEHFADYIRRVDVPGSKFAFDLHGRQIRYLTVTPQRKEQIETIDLVKGRADAVAPIVMAVTVEFGE